MSKEFREFYIRENQVNTGNKPDQEKGFPVKHTVETYNGIKQVYNRLLSSHIASDKVILKFLESITFKLNPEDIAKLNENGLVKLASDSDVANGVYSNIEALALQSYHTSRFIDESNNFKTLKYLDVETNTIYNTIGDVLATGDKFTTCVVIPTIKNTTLVSEGNINHIISDNSSSPYSHSVFTISDMVIGDRVDINVLLDEVYHAGDTIYHTIEITDLDTTTTTFLYALLGTATSRREIDIQLIKTNVGIQLKLNNYLGSLPPVNTIRNSISNPYINPTNFTFRIKSYTSSALSTITLINNIIELKRI